MNILLRRAAIGAALITFVPAALANEKAEWLVAPYAWLPDIELNQSGDGPGGGGGVSGADLLDKTDAVGMIRVEVAKRRWGVTADYIFLSLSDTQTLEFPGPLPNINARTELDLTVFEIGGFYRPSGEDRGVNLLFGYRNISADTTLLVTPEGSPTQRSDDSSDLNDIFLGARYLYRLNENWDVSLRGDYSFGDSEGVLNLLASIGYRVTGPFALQGGYRHAELEYEQDSAGETVATEIELTGPFLGFVFRF